MKKAIICFAILLLFAGCSVKKADNQKLEDLDFTVVKSTDVPKELQKVIEEKRNRSLRLPMRTPETFTLWPAMESRRRAATALR